MFTILKNGIKRPFRLGKDAYFKKLESKHIDPDTGSFIPDPTPMAPPIGYKKQPSMVELVREMVRSERLRQEVEAAGQETFEEAEDFDIGDDPPDLKSGWENDFDPPLEELMSAGREALKEKARKEAEKPAQKSAAEGAGEAEPPKRQPGEPEGRA